MENNKNKKRKISIIITSVIFVMLLAVSFTYAYFSANNPSTENSVRAGTLLINYEDDNLNSLTLNNISPIYDSEIKTKANKIGFTVNNTGSSLAYVEISLTDIVIDTELISPDFKWALYQGDTEITTGSFANLTGNTYSLINNIEIAPDSSESYQLCIWISETEQDQSIMKDRTFSAKITINGYQTEQTKLLSEVILENNPVNEGTPDFNTVATTDEGVFMDYDADGETYYFRGAVEDNYVKIGSMDMLWRIVRINGDGTIRLIANSTVGTSTFNSSYNNEKYVGYTYDNSAPNVQDGTNSTIKTYLENWYNTNMSEYDSLIASTRYCNDTSVASTSGTRVYYGARDRLETNKTPTFICPNTEKTYGGEYDLKVGLLSADEAAFAGGKYGSNNTSYYLNRGTWYWLGSPHGFNGYTAIGFLVGNNGYVSTDDVDYSYNAVVPVLNLRSDILYTSGNGTASEPYEVSIGATS